MKIQKITHNKKDYLELLLIGDEQESMIDRDLETGDLFLLKDEGEARGVCVATRKGDSLYELCNIAVLPSHQRKGYGKAMIEFLFHYYSDCRTLQLGTGDSPATLDFYHALGFREFGREKDHFLKYYDHPIYEGGTQLVDMVCLRRDRSL